jgi:uncharacterized protein
MFNTVPFIQPLIGGVLIGLASWLLLASLGRILGVSGIAASVLGNSAENQGNNAWRWAFLLGLMATGALVMFYLQPSPQASQQISQQMSQQSLAFIRLAIGGLLVGFGTVLGSGCTSGHGVCGLGRRSVRSLVAVLVFMGVAMLTVVLAH